MWRGPWQGRCGPCIRAAWVRGRLEGPRAAGLPRRFAGLVQEFNKRRHSSVSSRNCSEDYEGSGELSPLAAPRLAPPAKKDERMHAAGSNSPREPAVGRHASESALSRLSLNSSASDLHATV